MLSQIKKIGKVMCAFSGKREVLLVVNRVETNFN